MNFLFIYPPCCYPISPYMSLSLLASVLSERGYCAKCADLNADYYDDCILNKDLKTYIKNIPKSLA